MPMVAAGAVLAGLSTGITASFLATGVFVLNMTSFALAAGGSLLMSGAKMLMASGGKKKGSTAAQAQSSLQNIKQAIVPHNIVYGQRRVGGPVTFISSTQENLYLHMLIVLACHEVTEIGEVFFDDISIPPDHLDANGNVTVGKYAGIARVRKMLGSTAQAADTQLVAEVAEWSANHRLRGRAYIYVRLKYSQEIYAGRIPTITAVVRGKAVYDARDENARYTSNAALIAHAYLTDATYGFEVAPENVDTDKVIAAANICDEVVDTESLALSVVAVSTAAPDTLQLNCDTLPICTGDRVRLTTTGTLPGGLATLTDYYAIAYQVGTSGAIKPRIQLATSLRNAEAGTYIDITSTGSGTHTVTKTGEPRYQAAANVDTSLTLGDNMTQLLSGFNGRIVYAGGRWCFVPPAYQTPTFELTDDDIVAPVEVETKISRGERFNQIKGVYTSPANLWQPSDYPSLTDDAGVERDGQLIQRDFDLPVTFRPHTAQRIAKVELKKAAQDITVRVTANLRALTIQCGENIMLTHERFGWEQKEFEVTAFKFTIAGGGLAIQLELRESAPDTYDWASSEESDVDLAPNTNLPNALDVAAVTGLGFDSVPIATRDGDEAYNIKLSWTQHPDAFVIYGGYYEIQYKEDSALDWQPSFRVDGELVNSTIATASSGVEYDVRIRAVNNIGRRSEWQTLTKVVSGGSGGVTSFVDYGSVADAPTTNEDYGSVADAPTTNEDWGGI